LAIQKHLEKFSTEYVCKVTPGKLCTNKHNNWKGTYRKGTLYGYLETSLYILSSTMHYALNCISLRNIT